MEDSMVFSEPKSRQDWRRLREAAKNITAEKLPGADSHKLEEFRKNLMQLTGNFPASSKVSIKWIMIGIAPSFLLQMTQKAGIAEWGAIFHFAAAAFIFFGIIVGGIKGRKMFQEDAQKVITLGREIGLIEG